MAPFFENLHRMFLSPANVLYKPVIEGSSDDRPRLEIFDVSGVVLPHSGEKDGSFYESGQDYKKKGCISLR